MTAEERKIYMREYYKAHTDYFKQHATQWKKDNPDKVREQNHKQYLKRKARKEAAAHDGAGSD